MSKKNKNKKQESTQSNQGASMSQESQNNQESVNPEVHEKKESNEGTTASAEETKTESEKKEEGGFFRVTGIKLKNTVVGGISFARECIATAWNAVLDYYNNMKKDIEEKGVLKWFSDGFRKSAYGFLKFSVKVTAFVLVHNLIVNATGFSILNPYFLLGVLVVALGLSLYASVKAQKEMGSVTAKTTGRHLIEDMIAA